MAIVTVDRHKLLFCKKGIQDGNVVDMSEHGRAGGVSTGQPFKFTDTVNYEIKLIEDGSYTYIAYANPGTAEADAAWKVMRLDSTTGLKVTFADNDAEFDNVATDLPALFP